MKAKVAAILVAKRIVSSSIEMLPFEEALQAALQQVQLEELQNNPAALCLLSAKDERRQWAGSIVRQLICSNASDIQHEFFALMEKHNVTPLAAQSFWYAHNELTRKWMDNEKPSVCRIESSDKSKPFLPSRPVLFAIHIPRA